jgi:carbonic anhydrase
MGNIISLMVISMADKKRFLGISRRNLLKIAGGGALAAGLGVKLITPTKVSAEQTSKITADQALQKLMDGNKRYVSEKRTFPDQIASRRTEIAADQHPFAIILGCADSRVPPEILFDEGLGDIFDIRVAGNIVDDAIIGSIEYAVEHLGVPVVVVLGHERCGAVKAALAGGEIPGHISHLVEAIKPAVDKVKGKPGDPLDNAVRANIQLVVQELKSSEPILKEFIEKGKLKIVGARYDLDSGEVTMVS